MSMAHNLRHNALRFTWPSACSSCIVCSCMQMGYTRSRRYAKHKGGTKSQALETEDAEKAESAQIFHAKWREAVEDPQYQALKARHQQRRRKTRK